MKILEYINLKTQGSAVEYLIIGGHAVNAYGFSRQTGDLDLLVSKKDRVFWIEAIKSLQYKIFQEHEAFCRFTPNAHINWPIDLMFVDDLVFKSILSESIFEDFYSVKVRIPHIKHLIALKLHALKQRQAHREDKDILDIKNLLSYNKSVIDEKTLLELCTKYDRLDLYEFFKKNMA